jgi:RNA polymerase sigma factor (sigma-70 family)
MEGDKISDGDLWERFKKGDSEALSCIYNQHVQLLFRYGKKFTSDKELVKDTIQDLFYDLIRTRKNLGNTDSIKFYLIASFRRKLTVSLKKRQLNLDIDVEKKMDAEFCSIPEQELSESKELSAREKLIQEGLKSLSPKQREILYYRYTCNFDYEQICRITSLKYDSARKQNFRALQSLKNWMSTKISKSSL